VITFTPANHTNCVVPANVPKLVWQIHLAGKKQRLKPSRAPPVAESLR
jgi:hypothetical protein